MLQTLPYPPDILFLSETKIKLSRLPNVNLTGYQPVILVNSQTNASGVGVYVTDKLTVIPLGKNELNLIKNSKALFKIIKFLNASDLAMSIISKKVKN